MKKEKHRILAWETDTNLNPTGKERIFLSDSCRTVAKQIAHELGGEARGTSVYNLLFGKRWFTQRIR